MATPGVRNTLTGFFSSVVLSDRDHDRPCLPDPTVPFDRLLEKHADAIQRLRLSEGQVQRVLDDPVQFRQLQQGLQHCHTMAATAPHILDAVRERSRELERQDAIQAREVQQQAAAQQKDRHQFQIRHELANARIKARQAMEQHKKSSSSSSSSLESGSESPKVEKETITPTTSTDDSTTTTPGKQQRNSHQLQQSPDSVAAFVTLEQLPRYDLDLSSDDGGDIQEIIEEGDEE